MSTSRRERGQPASRYSGIRRRLQAVEIPLFIFTFVTGVYLAVGNVLLAVGFPHKRTWEPWSAWFVLLLVCAVWVPLYALYQTVEARLQAREAKRQAEAQLGTKARADLAVACQRIVGVIVDACAEVTVNDLAACVWTVRPDGGFDEVARFYLPIDRPPGPVPWHKGKGVAGWAWAIGKDLFADLRPLLARLDAGGADAFDALPEAQRFGLSAGELDSSRRYTGVGAIQLFATSGPHRLLGLLILDYAGDKGFDCVVAQAQRASVTSLTGGLAGVLTAADAKL